VVGDHEGPLLVTARAEATAPAGEGDEELVAAEKAADLGEALVEVTAGQEALNCPRNHRPPEAVAPAEAIIVDALKVVEVPIKPPPQG
jgi:hypothetical protein